jgi:hypothetical protein
VAMTSARYVISVIERWIHEVDVTITGMMFLSECIAHLAFFKHDLLRVMMLCIAQQSTELAENFNIFTIRPSVIEVRVNVCTRGGLLQYMRMNVNKNS